MRPRSIGTEVLAVLSAATIEGSVVKLTQQLPRKLYEDTNQVLEALGGKWNRRLKGHHFTEDPRERLDAAILTASYEKPEDFGYFPTPPDVIMKLLDLADVRSGHDCLEPSAGQGAIAECLCRLVGKKLVQTVELRPENVEVLEEKGFHYPVQQDFLALAPIRFGRQFHRIVMNPPFAKQQDIDHVLHAYRSFLMPGGRLVSVMAAGVTFRQDRKATEFRRLVDAYGYWEELPEGSFEVSGTGVNTVVVVLNKPEDLPAYQERSAEPMKGKAATAIEEPEYRLLSLTEVFQSKLNPRHQTNSDAQAELEQSIRTQGIVTPLLVRPIEKGFEIAAGHRRFRAAAAIGLETVPCVVRNMTDEQFLEILTLENLQREDIHPLDEAKGYHQLMTKCKQDVARIAERVGRSVKYIYDRIKLLDLVKGAQQLFYDGRITAGHAILLARLTTKDQERIIAIDKEGYGRDGGLWQTQRDLLEHPDHDDLSEDPAISLKAVSVRELEAYIAKHIRFDAQAVDPMLFPETVTQLQVAQEVKEKVIHITHDHYVQDDAKSEQRTYCESSWQRADGEEGSKTCDRSVTGVIVVGYGRGEAFKVCTDKKRCQVHWGQEIRAAAKREKEALKSGVSGEERRRREQEREKAEQARKELERERWDRAVPAMLKAVADQIKKAPTKATGRLGDILVKNITRHLGLGKTLELVPRGKSADDLIRHLAFALVAGEASRYWAHEHFPKLAKAFGVDVKKIVDEVAPIEKPKADDADKKNGKKKKAA